MLSVFPVFLSVAVHAYGVNLSDSVTLNDVFTMDNLFDVNDIFGIGAEGWSISIEFRYTNEDPDSSSAVWSAWAALPSGSLSIRAAEFRIKLESYEEGISPAIDLLSATADMPDRVERGDNLTVPVTGATVTYVNAFFKTPAVAILLQNGAVDDKIEFTAKTASGFSFKVYNATSAGYVERTYDHISSGFGKVMI